MNIEELIEELENVKVEHGNLEVGVNYEGAAYKDMSEAMVEDVYGTKKLWIVAKF